MHHMLRSANMIHTFFITPFSVVLLALIMVVIAY